MDRSEIGSWRDGEMVPTQSEELVQAEKQIQPIRRVQTMRYV